MTAGAAMVAELEEVLETALRLLLDAYAEMVQVMGTRPAGWVEGDIWDQLAAYLELRDDPAAWEQQIQMWAQTMGRDAAEVTALYEATRMEDHIQKRSIEAVRTELVLRRMHAAEPALRQMNKLLAMPKAQILPPLPPMSDIDILSGMEQPPPQIAQPVEPWMPVETPPMAPPRVDTGLNSFGEMTGPLEAGGASVVRSTGMGVGAPVPGLQP